MKIPGLDSLVYRTFWGLDRLGYIRTVRDLAGVHIETIGGILVAVTTVLGDSVCFTPALDALRSRFPRARIIGLFQHAFAEMYRQDPRLDAVILYGGNYVRWREMVRSLQAARCELTLVPYIADPDLIPLLSEGFNPEHALARVATMLRHLGCPVTDLAPRLHVGDTQREDAAAWLLAHGITPGASLVGMHPGASIQEKRWPAGNFAAAAQALLADDAKRWLVLSGSRRARALRGYPPSVRGTRPCGERRRGTAAHGASRRPGTRDVISGQRHRRGARCLRHPSLTLFWRSDPARSGPLHHLDRHRVFARAPLCPPCRTRNCRYPDCANEIMVDRVLDIAREMLSRRTVAGYGRSVL